MYTKVAELRGIQKRLCEEALAARANAYCKYSQFAVGAAVISEGGRIFRGVNVENASYGLTSCAERNAIFAMAAAGGRRLAMVAVAASEMPLPCGACRQVLWEFCSGEDTVQVLVIAPDGEDGYNVRLLTMHELLPNPFEFTAAEPAGQAQG